MSPKGFGRFNLAAKPDVCEYSICLIGKVVSHRRRTASSDQVALSGR
jgi:hypothetical protein